LIRSITVFSANAPGTMRTSTAMVRSTNVQHCLLRAEKKEIGFHISFCSSPLNVFEMLHFCFHKLIVELMRFREKIITGNYILKIGVLNTLRAPRFHQYFDFGFL
jgi:hypothetical protein